MTGSPASVREAVAPIDPPDCADCMFGIDGSSLAPLADGRSSKSGFMPNVASKLAEPPDAFPSATTTYCPGKIVAPSGNRATKSEPLDVVKVPRAICQ